ncbi:PP2C family protein-serine/threonine phosphatase [Serinicoccus sp. LYQ131]|uniref:PP2C family protein-serine/threonine phosphatase n=1 Tax=Serinicoccus sp. LYQ131 TaxID=3378797 RepID=UPI0038528F5E
MSESNGRPEEPEVAEQQTAEQEVTEPETTTPEHEAQEAEPFSEGPPPLPEPMLVLDGDLPPVTEQSEDAPVDHGTCAACGGAFDEDGWCTRCGERRPDPRDHYSEAPAPHAAGVCDRGVRHTENQDSLAVLADMGSPGEAALVVCDGVSSAPRSGEASLAAAAAAVRELADRSTPARDRLARAAAAGSAAVSEVGRQVPDGAPSCTFVAGVLEEGVLTVGSVGDSRAYWFPDEGPGVLLTTDDSMAEEQIRAGMSRVEAETGPLGHTITRWLGPDAPDHRPAVTVQEVGTPGWVLLCSDGLWNYASEASDLERVLRTELSRTGQQPLPLAEALVAWANGRGGIDNVTVALARVEGTRQDGRHV